MLFFLFLEKTNSEPVHFFSYDELVICEANVDSKTKTCQIYYDKFTCRVPSKLEIPETCTSEWYNNKYKITSIGDFSLSYVEEIKFSNAITDPGYWSECKLTKIEWGTGIKRILSSAFTNAELDIVEIPNVDIYQPFGNFEHCRVIIIPEGVKNMEGAIGFGNKYVIKCKSWTNLELLSLPQRGKTVIYYFGLSEPKCEQPTSAPDKGYQIFVKPDYDGDTFLGGKVSKTLSDDFFFKESNGGVILSDTFKPKGPSFIIPAVVPEGLPSSGKTITELGDFLFLGWNDLKEIVIPKDVETIHFCAFYTCSKLTKITFETGSVLREIDSDAFEGTGITEFTFPTTLIKLGKSVFRDCTSLKAVYAPANIEFLNEFAFIYCYSIERFVIMSNKETVSSYGSIPIEDTLEISEGITTIDQRCFIDSRISKLILPSTLRCIGKESFQNCFNLESLIIPSLVTEIGDNAFASCTALKEVFYCGNNCLSSTCFDSSNDFKYVFVNKDYEGEQFCNIPVKKKLDQQCKIIEEPDVTQSVTTQSVNTQSDTTESDKNDSQKSEDGLGKGAALVITISGIVVVIIIVISVVIAIFKCKRASNSGSEQEDEIEENP